MGRDLVLRGKSILVVDDHDPHRTLLVNFLGSLGAEVDEASGGREGLAKMAERTFDLVLLDLRMDDIDGIEVLKRAKADNLARNYTMMSAEGTVPAAVEAIRLGASDFLMKPFELRQLLDVATRVLRLETGDGAQRDPRAAWRDKFAPGLIGEHENLLEIFLVLERIAHTDCTVLVLGESGTGKELIARAIHNASDRTTAPFVPVNCGAIPETLIESELFGHAKGSFSGATSAREGRFAAADTGTLFLDEIGEMSLNVQVKFLRVLQEGEYVPVGETKPRTADVRIIAATNKNLEEMAEQGKFREDLFYRLNLIPIHLPPLRDRITDVPLLAGHFVKSFNQRRGRDIRGFTQEALDLMLRYNWPGNVRELENTVERMTLLHQGEGVLDVVDLPTKIQRLALEAQPAAATQDASVDATLHDDSALRNVPVEIPPAPIAAVEPAPAPPTPAPAALVPAAMKTPSDFALPEDGIDLRKAVEEFEFSLIQQALERTGGNRNQASRLLGMNRTTLVEKLRKRRAQEEKRAAQAEQAQQKAQTN